MLYFANSRPTAVRWCRPVLPPLGRAVRTCPRARRGEAIRMSRSLSRHAGTALVLGGLLLVNTGAAPGLPGVSPYAAMGVAAGLGGFFFFAVYKVYKARRARPATGREGLVGRIAQTRTDLAPDGMVFVEGELWHARSVDGSIPSGQAVRVVAANGLQLQVMPEPAAKAGEAMDTRKL
jgi:membrane-bound serine protease (ClpP class)